MSGNVQGGGNWKACVFCKIIVVEFVILLDPSRHTLKGKRGFSGGAHVPSWGLRTPTHPPQAGAGVALSLLFLGVFQQVPGRLEEEDTIQHSPPVPFSSFSGKKRAEKVLEGEEDHGGHRSPWHTVISDTDWHKKEFLGLVRAAFWQFMRHLSAVEGKCNEIQQQRRGGCVEWLPPQKTIPLTPLALHYLWNMGLPEHDKISHSEPL